MSEPTPTTPEFSPQSQDVIAFNEAMASINQHNKQFSLGRVLARAVIEGVQKAERTQDLVDAGATQEEAEQTVDFVDSDKTSLFEEEQMARSIVGVANAPVLEAIGLRLSPLRTKGTVHSEGKEQPIGEVRLGVADGGKLTNFLLTVNPDLVDDDFRQNATYLADSLITETADDIANSTTVSTETLETLAYGKGIVASLEHIGLVNTAETERIGKLYDHAQKGDVKEYVQADSIGLFREPGKEGYSPSKWQRDASSAYLARHWNQVLEVVSDTKANPNAHELFTQVAESAQASLDFAKTDWAKMKQARGSSGGSYGQGFEEVFETVGLELKFITSPDEEKK